MQWNIWYKQDIKDIASFLLKNKADIICLQELMYNYSGQDVANTAKYLAETLSYNYYDKSIAIGGETWQQGSGIFTSFPIVKQSYVWINEPVGPVESYDNEHRAYVETVLDTGKALLTVGTTHMSYTDRYMQTKRKQQETDRLIEIIKSKNSNYILTGDFNSEPDSYTIQQVAKYLRNVGPAFVEKTWSTKPFSYNGFNTDELLWRLDYIFASNELKVSDARILNTGYSDHLPIFAKLKIDL